MIVPLLLDGRSTLRYKHIAYSLSWYLYYLDGTYSTTLTKMKTITNTKFFPEFYIPTQVQSLIPTKKP